MACRKSKFEMKIRALLLRRYVSFLFTWSVRVVDKDFCQFKSKRCHESVATWFSKKLALFFKLAE